MLHEPKRKPIVSPTPPPMSAPILRRSSVLDIVHSSSVILQFLPYRGSFVISRYSCHGPRLPSTLVSMRENQSGRSTGHESRTRAQLGKHVERHFGSFFDYVFTLLSSRAASSDQCVIF
jgi:hypothetical protein